MKGTNNATKFIIYISNDNCNKTPTTDATTAIVITSIFSPGFGGVDSVIFALVVVSKSEKNIYFIMNGRDNIDY
jgi:hypothetical protein